MVVIKQELRAEVNTPALSQIQEEPCMMGRTYSIPPQEAETKVSVDEAQEEETKSKRWLGTREMARWLRMLAALLMRIRTRVRFPAPI